MAGVNTQDIDVILKDVYASGVVEGVNNMNKLKDLISFQTESWTGRQVKKAIHTSRNNSVGFSGEDAAFAEAGRQGYVTLDVTQRKMTARVRFTMESIKDTMSNRGAFISTQTAEMNKLVDDIHRVEERTLNSDGRGVLARINDATPAQTLTLDDPGGVRNDNFGNRYFGEAGIYVAAVDPATGLLRGGDTAANTVRRVDAIPITADNNSIRLDSAPPSTWADNDWLVRAANDEVTSLVDTEFEQRWWGLMALVDDGTYRANYFGQTRTDIDACTSYVRAATGTLSDDVLQQTVDIIDQKMGGMVDVLLCHHDVRRTLTAIADTQRRYMGQDLRNPDPGTNAAKNPSMGLTWGGIEVRAIRDFPQNVIMMLDRGQAGLQEYASVPGEWDDTDGQILVRSGQGKQARQAYEAWWYCRKQFFMEKPAVCARLDGVTTSSVTVQRPAGR